MAMFSSGNEETERSRTTRSGNEKSLSILAQGLKVTGEIDCDGVLKIEGKVEGSIRAQGQVLVVKGGEVDGDIHTRHAVLGGHVRGKINADERVEVQSTSIIDGDITTPKIAVQEGGKVNGSIKMGKPNALSPKPAPRPAQPEIRKLHAG